MIFASAYDRGIEICLENGERTKTARTPEELSAVFDTLPKKAFTEGIAFLSSMDFAEESGFKTNRGARDLWDATENLRAGK